MTLWLIYSEPEHQTTDSKWKTCPGCHPGWGKRGVQQTRQPLGQPDRLHLVEPALGRCLSTLWSWAGAGGLQPPLRPVGAQRWVPGREPTGILGSRCGQLVLTSQSLCCYCYQCQFFCRQHVERAALSPEEGDHSTGRTESGFLEFEDLSKITIREI